MRIKKDGDGYIDRDTGRKLSKAEYEPIVNAARERGRAGAKNRWGGHTSPTSRPEQPKKISLKKVGKNEYIDRNTGRQLTIAEWMPRVSEQKAYGQMSKNVRIQRALGTVARNYKMPISEVKQRYVNFVKAYDRYGDQVDWAEYMYPKP